MTCLRKLPTSEKKLKRGLRIFDDDDDDDDEELFLWYG